MEVASSAEPCDAATFVFTPNADACHAPTAMVPFSPTTARRCHDRCIAQCDSVIRCDPRIRRAHHYAITRF